VVKLTKLLLKSVTAETRKSLRPSLGSTKKSLGEKKKGFAHTTSRGPSASWGKCPAFLFGYWVLRDYWNNFSIITPKKGKGKKKTHGEEKGGEGNGKAYRGVPDESHIMEKWAESDKAGIWILSGHSRVGRGGGAPRRNYSGL